jgi:hypothetical protein
MTLFPQLSDTYYVDNDHDILKLMDYTYSKYITINQSFWSEADVDSRFKAGDQTLWNDIYGNLPAFRKRQFNFNLIRRFTNMISGYQRQHRKSTVASPVYQQHQQGADQITKLFYHINNRNGVLHTLSDAFDGALTTGMNLLSTWIDYRNDPVNGDIRVDNVSYNGYLIDPYFQKQDLSDCNSIWTRKYYTKAQCASLLPGRESEIKSLPGWGNRDGKFQFQPQSYNYAMQDLLIYDEFWYLDTRKQLNLVDLETGECIEWQGQSDDLQQFLSMYPNITPVENVVPTVKLAISVQGKVMYHGPNPMGVDRYPFTPVWAYYEPQIPYFPWRVQGVVRGLRDAQYLFNRTRITQLDILESQVTSGYIYKENSLVNPKDVFLQGQGRGVALKAGADMGDVQKIQPPSIDPSHIQISEMLAGLMGQISGVNEELLGAANDSTSGIETMLRQGAGLVTLQPLFDQLDMSQKLLGELHLEIIQKNWTPGKIRQIINEEPVPEFYNRVFSKYDVVIEEGLNTSTQRQMQFAQLLQMREMGIAVPPDQLLKSSTLQNKNELIEAIQKAEETQSKQAEEQHQAQVAVLQAQIKDLESKSMANEGLGMERASRIHENRALAVERIAEAERARAGASLDEVKAAKELQDLDLSHLERALNIIAQIKQRNAEESKQATEKEVKPSPTL